MPEAPSPPNLLDMHAILRAAAHPWRCADQQGARNGDPVIRREMAWRVGVMRVAIGLLTVAAMAALPLPHSGAMLVLGAGLLYIFSGWAEIMGDAYA